MERRGALVELITSSDAAAFGRLDQLVDDWRAHLKRAETAVAEISGTADEPAVAFLSADAMLLRSLELFQQAFSRGSFERYTAQIEEANAQAVLGGEAMADAIFLIIGGEDADSPMT